MPTVEELAADLTVKLEAFGHSFAHVLDRDRLQKALADATPLEQAELHCWHAYAVAALSWVYLKTQGVDPANHPVTAELDRIKTVFAELQAAKAKDEAAKAAPKLDKDAASRFIKHAIATGGSAAAPPPPRPAPRPREPEHDVGTHTRFSFLSRESDAPARPDDSDEDLAVFADGDEPEAADAEPSDAMPDVVPSTEPTAKRKKKRSRAPSDAEADAAPLGPEDKKERKRLKAERKAAKAAKKLAKAERKAAKAAVAAPPG